MSRKRKVAVVLSLLFLAGAGAAGDRLLGRRDRLRFEVETERLQRLRDAILRFQLDRERFPARLSELVPGYIPAHMTSFQPDAGDGRTCPILWDPATGTLSGSVPFRIRGLFPRGRALALTVPNRTVAKDPLTGENAFRQAPDAATLGPEDVVVEAEMFDALTYGWQIEPGESASGGACIHLKEGAGDLDHSKVEFDPKVRSGDFYNISRDNSRIEARCDFEIPEAGAYFLSVRTKAERSSCSNIIVAKVDDRVFTIGDNGTEPFVWLWHCPGKMSLKKGPHSIRFLTYQDGVSVDQAVLTRKRPALSGARTFRGGHPQSGARPSGAPPLVLSLSVDTLTVSADSNPKVSLYVRNPDPRPRRVRLLTSLDLPGGRVRERARDIVLPVDAPLSRLPCEIDLPRPLDMREYLLRCRIVEGDETVQERTLVLTRGYDWSILGPLPFMAVTDPGEPERDADLAARYRFNDEAVAWRKYDETFTDPLGILDFGRMLRDNTYDAGPPASLYAYTEVDSPRSGLYRLKAQGDDHLVVWLNGVKAAALAGPESTAIRSASEFLVPLRAGRNAVLFRLNQQDRQWQAAIRFRTEDDKVSDVTGVPHERQIHAPPRDRGPGQ